MGKYHHYSLNHHAINGKTHNFYGHFPSTLCAWSLAFKLWMAKHCSYKVRLPRHDLVHNVNAVGKTMPLGTIRLSSPWLYRWYWPQTLGRFSFVFLKCFTYIKYSCIPWKKHTPLHQIINQLRATRLSGDPLLLLSWACFDAFRGWSCPWVLNKVDPCGSGLEHQNPPRSPHSSCQNEDYDLSRVVWKWRKPPNGQQMQGTWQSVWGLGVVFFTKPFDGFKKKGHPIYHQFSSGVSLMNQPVWGIPQVVFYHRFSSGPAGRLLGNQGATFLAHGCCMIYVEAYGAMGVPLNHPS